MTGVETLTPKELQEAPETPGVARKIAFQTANNILVHARADRNAATAWHHHVDRHVYGYLLEGTARIEHGPEGTQLNELAAGNFLHIEPRTVHRDINPGDTEQVWILNFVGTGPLVENVDGPDPE